MRTLVIGAAAAALLVATPTAHAASDSVYSGSCQLTAQLGLGGGQYEWVGTLSGVVLVYSTNTPSDNPVSADLTCQVKVSGSVVETYTEPGTFVVWQANQAVFVAVSTDTIEVCTIVDYTSNTTPTAASCVPWP